MKAEEIRNLTTKFRNATYADQIRIELAAQIAELNDNFNRFFTVMLSNNNVLAKAEEPKKERSVQLTAR